MTAQGLGCVKTLFGVWNLSLIANYRNHELNEFNNLGTRRFRDSGLIELRLVILRRFYTARVSTGPTGPARIESACWGGADGNHGKADDRCRWSAFWGLAEVVGSRL